MYITRPFLHAGADIRYKTMCRAAAKAPKEENDMSPRNTAKADIVLKNFWKDNAHFADLFNAVLFDGEQKLHPEDLREADVDLSSVLKFNGHIETIQRLRDVVKKTA